jgi:asparagine synthase (glutamine-hydrolysing)
MCDVLTHRGPDEDGYLHGDGVALGMRRLSIVDVVGGSQPAFNEDGTIAAVHNGEIYNFDDLRRELAGRGHRLTGRGDTETLVHLYEEHGSEMVHRLRGMFAFAVWDARQRRLLLARDRLGKKPLYYRVNGDTLAFASELKALLQDPEISGEIDPVALHHYLTLQYVPAPWSIVAGVSKLPPGHVLDWHDGRYQVRRYWRPDFTPRVPAHPDEAAEELRRRLLDATRVRLVGERPVGAFLSGGLDSSAVVAAMAQLSPTPVKTFSIGFADPCFDERRYARAVAERYGAEHHEMLVEPADLSILPELAWYFDEPFADSSAIPSYYVARLAASRVTVALTGDGGDEAFGGYRRYELVSRLGWLTLPGPVATASARLGRTVTDRTAHRSRMHLAGRALELLGERPSLRYARMMSYFTPEQKRVLYTSELARELSGVDTYTLLDRAYAESAATDPVGRVINVDVLTYLPGDLLVKLDLSTMANSLEARSPLLDQELVEWAVGLPTEYKVRRGQTKWLFKRAVAPWLPDELLHRPKMGFGVPLAAWLRGALRDLAHDVLTDGTARGRGLFRPDAVARLLREHDDGIDHAPRLWALLQFELWHRRHIDGRARRPSCAV